MMVAIFKPLSVILEFYALLCFVRIVATWIPDISYSSFVRFLSAICDPFLNIFRSLKFLRVGMFDFSPTAAICILVALSSVCANFANYGIFRLGTFLAMLLGMAWSIFSTVFWFFEIIILIRIIFLFLRRDNSQIFERLDYLISPVIFRISAFFMHNRPTSQKNALLISFWTIFFAQLLGKFLVLRLSSFLQILPF